MCSSNYRLCPLNEKINRKKLKEFHIWLWRQQGLLNSPHVVSLPCCSWQILLAVWQTSHRLAPNERLNLKHTKYKAKSIYCQKVNRLVIMHVVYFYVCWAPTCCAKCSVVWSFEHTSSQRTQWNNRNTYRTTSQYTWKLDLLTSGQHNRLGIHRGQTSEAVFSFKFVRCIHDAVKTWARIYKLVGECKYIFISLK